MMIKYIKQFIVLAVTLGFYGCSVDEVEPLFETDVNTRVNETIADYKQTLINSEFGWKTVYQPNPLVGGFNIYMKFNEDNSVTVVSDYRNGLNDLETTYRVDVGHFPQLIFENFSTYHSLFLIDNFSLEAEFEFLFESVTEDRIEFRSKSDGSDATMIVFERANANDMALVESLREEFEPLEIGFETTSVLRNLVIVDADNTLLFNSTFAFNPNKRTATITVFNQDTGEISSITLPVTVTESGFEFLDPFVISGLEITSFTYDADNNFYVSQDGGVLTVVGYDLASVTTSLVPSLFSEEADEFGIEFGRYLYFDDTSGNFLTATSEDFLQLGKKTGFNIVDIVFDDARFQGSPTSIEFFDNNTGASIIAVFSVERIPGERIVFTFLGATADIDPILGPLSLLAEPNGWYIQRTNESRFINNPSFLMISVALPNYRLSLYGI